MTLSINVLQSLISRNRGTITDQHKMVDFWKKAHVYNEISEDYKASCYGMASNVSKDIAKLATIQKALKRELAHNIHVQRCERWLQKARRVGMEAAGEVG